MERSLVSNPPYNMKWSPPPFAQLQPRFSCCDLPPANNSNFAFILTALYWIDNRAAILLPNGIQSTSNRQEAAIRAALVEGNVIKAVIALPDGMFESTSIPTCVLLLDKRKQSRRIVMVDMRQDYAEEQRDQKGQYGGASHEQRTYHKTVKVLTDDGMQKALNAINEGKDIPGFSRAVPVEEIRNHDYILTPGRYIESVVVEIEHRSYADIASDYNRIVAAKNAVKLTINESLAKSLGLYDTLKLFEQDIDVSKAFEIVGQKALKQNCVQLSKNRAEFKIENKDSECLPEILQLFIGQWKQRIMMLNNAENRILAEFRDALLPELMNGRIKLTEEGKQNEPSGAEEAGEGRTAGGC